MRSRNPVVHLTVREGMSSVFPAQVAKPMALLKRRGWDPTLLVFSPLGEFVRPALRASCNRRILEIRRISALALHRLPSPPSRFLNLWSELPLLRRWLRRRLRGETRAIIHCRGYLAARLALDARANMPDLRVIFDCRGLNGVEHAYVRGYADMDSAPEDVAQEARAIEAAERQAARSADRLLCVSQAMKQVVCERWNIGEEKVSVVPCCTDAEAAMRAKESRESARLKLGLSGRFVVAYCGSLERWQAPEASLQWFKGIARVRPDAHFLAITTHPERITRLANDAGIPEADRTVLTLPHTEVVECLAAADCGLLVRDRSLVNRVASPVKFAEYLIAGVPVLISDGVGDYSAAVRAHGLGVVLPGSSDAKAPRAIEALMALIEADGGAALADRCNAYARANLQWSSAVDELQGIYESLEEVAR